MTVTCGQSSAQSSTMLVVCLLYTTHLASGRLVLSSWSDLYMEDGSVDTERLAREADLLTVTTRPYQDCPEVDIEIFQYEVLLLVGGEEVRESVELENIKDTWNFTKTVGKNKDLGMEEIIVVR